jgi:hypothetical protein
VGGLRQLDFSGDLRHPARSGHRRVLREDQFVVLLKLLLLFASVWSVTSGLTLFLFYLLGKTLGAS